MGVALSRVSGRTGLLVGAYGLLLAGSFALAAVTPHGTGDKGVSVITLPFFVVGLLVVRRLPRHAVGWSLLALAFAVVLSIDAAGYSILVYRVGDHWLPFGRLAVALAPAWVPVILLLPLPLLLFPDGRLPDHRWRWVFWGYLALGCEFLGQLSAEDAHAFTERHVVIDSSGQLTALSNGSGTFTAVANVVEIVGYATLFLAMVAYQIRSYRRATGDLRQQLKWFLCCGFVAVAGLILASQWNVFSILFTFVIALPLGIGFGILKYRLYDIDRLISRTISYAVVTALLAGVFLAIVLLATRVLPFSSPVAVAASTLAAAALFNPVRRRVQTLVDRRFNRTRYDAAAIAAGFGARLRDAIELEAVRVELLEAVVSTVAPAHATVWLTEERRQTAGRRV
jgi:peptidoglycan/LPS O-acetylase OafA/YrhL